MVRKNPINSIKYLPIKDVFVMYGKKILQISFESSNHMLPSINLWVEHIRKEDAY